MMVREASIDFAVELRHLAPEAAVKPRRQHAGDAVAAIDGDAHRPRELDVADDALDVRIEHVALALLAGPRLEIACLDTRAKPLYFIAVERGAGDHHLQAVVVRRVVAAADRDAAVAFQLVRREISDRRRRHADIDDAAPGRDDALGERGLQLGAGEAAVAADGESGCVPFAPERAEGAAALAHDRCGEAFADDAADVVGTKNFGGQFHGRKNSSSRRMSQSPGKPTWPPRPGSSSVTAAAALRVAAISAGSGRKGSLRALIKRVGTRICASHGPLDDELQ